MQPLVLKADERPLDMENVVADHVGFTVFDQELKVVHGFLNRLLLEHVAHQTQVDIGWRRTSSEYQWSNDGIINIHRSSSEEGRYKLLA